MITVSDMTRSVQFYRDTLGLPLRFGSPDWSEFDTGTTVLALHGGEEVATRSAEPRAGTASIGFYVENLVQKYDELSAKGVKFSLSPTKREEEGIKLVVCLDPDGLPISIAEHSK